MSVVININEAKAKLSEYLEVAARGERVLICNRNRPVAELRVVAGARTSPRPVGGAEGRVSVPPAFFDELPEEVIRDFEGENRSGHPATRVASGRRPRKSGPAKAATRAPKRQRRRR